MRLWHSGRGSSPPLAPELAVLFNTSFIIIFKDVFIRLDFLLNCLRLGPHSIVYLWSFQSLLLLFIFTCCDFIILMV